MQFLFIWKYLRNILHFFFDYYYIKIVKLGINNIQIYFTLCFYYDFFLQKIFISKLYYFFFNFFWKNKIRKKQKLYYIFLILTA